MKRRNFLLSGSASAALAMTGCGGGEGSAAAGMTPGALRQRISGSTAGSGSTRGSTSGSGSATSSGSATTTSNATSGTGTALGYPFGARLSAYGFGIKPTQSNATMDALLGKQYDAWKTARVVPATSIVAGGYAIQFSDPNYLVVSEGMGYGMLITVLFAGHDASAKQVFDGLLSVARARYAYSVAQYDPDGKHLMDWRINADGSRGDGWSAADGDLDIAMALLMAHKQWGSTGTWNYKQEALNTIAALKSWNFDAATGAVGGRGVRTSGSARISDYMIGHFRAFRVATGDPFWDLAITKNLANMDYLQKTYSPGVGLLPDWAVNVTTATPAPSPGYIGDGIDQEMDYWWNSARDPWRLASDYVLSGDVATKTVCGRLVQFFQTEVAAAGGDVTVIGTGYALDGTQLTGGNSPAYLGPIMLGACIDASYQAFLNAMWNWNASHLITGYYDSEIQLLSMIVASGNWWTPQDALATTTTGPNLIVNGDFATDMSGWNNWGNAAVVGGALNVTAAGGAAQDVYTKLTAGKTYRLSGSANITASAEGVFIGIKLMDSAGNVMVGPMQLLAGLTPTAFSMSFTAPAGLASGYVYVWKNANAATAVVDNLSLVAT